MDRIQISATFRNIPADKLADFKALAAEATRIARGESATLGYDWFAGDATETSFLVREVYQNSDAVLAHLGAVGAQLGAMLSMGATVEVAVFGNPSPAVLDAGAAFSPKIYPHVMGK